MPNFQGPRSRRPLPKKPKTLMDLPGRPVGDILARTGQTIRGAQGLAAQMELPTLYDPGEWEDFPGGVHPGLTTVADRAWMPNQGGLLTGMGHWLMRGAQMAGVAPKPANLESLRAQTRRYYGDATTMNQSALQSYFDIQQAPVDMTTSLLNQEQILAKTLGEYRDQSGYKEALELAQEERAQDAEARQLISAQHDWRAEERAENKYLEEQSLQRLKAYSLQLTQKQQLLAALKNVPRRGYGVTGDAAYGTQEEFLAPEANKLLDEIFALTTLIERENESLYEADRRPWPKRWSYLNPPPDVPYAGPSNADDLSYGEKASQYATQKVLGSAPAVDLNAMNGRAGPLEVLYESGPMSGQALGGLPDTLGVNAQREPTDLMQFQGVPGSIEGGEALQAPPPPPGDYEAYRGAQEKKRTKKPRLYSKPEFRALYKKNKWPDENFDQDYREYLKAYGQ